MFSFPFILLIGSLIVRQYTLQCNLFPNILLFSLIYEQSRYSHSHSYAATKFVKQKVLQPNINWMISMQIYHFGCQEYYLHDLVSLQSNKEIRLQAEGKIYYNYNIQNVERFLKFPRKVKFSNINSFVMANAICLFLQEFN